MPDKQSENCRCLNCPHCRPYVSVHYGWKYSQKKTLTVEWILMLIQNPQPVISAGIRRGCESLRGAIYSNLWASPTWKWASKERRITGKSCEGVHMSPNAHHHFSTSNIIDHPLPKYGQFTKLYPVWTSVLNSRPSVLLFSSRLAAMWAGALFWIRLLASTTLACCGF